mmetsp:Transcript_35346/g.92904  ORF Transcript_35346/g.92904 Transcript_35346/m.92904 type:complete len:227 (+) Transcript_35346:56-736(+)
MMLHLLAPLLTGFAINTPSAPLARERAAPMRIAMAEGNEAVSFGELDGSSVRVGIIRARWHEETIDALAAGAKKAMMEECGVKEENIIETEVPGSFELPLAARYLALSGTVDAIIPIGLLIKGDTYHFEVISDQVTSGLMSVGLQTGVPVLMGVLTVNNEEQAKYRSEGANNHGLQWGKAAVEMALLRLSALGGGKSKKTFLGFGDVEEPAAKEQPLVGGGKPLGF